jgi:hypothetical protein
VIGITLGGHHVSESLARDGTTKIVKAHFNAPVALAHEDSMASDH